MEKSIDKPGQKMHTYAYGHSFWSLRRCRGMLVRAEITEMPGIAVLMARRLPKE